MIKSFIVFGLEKPILNYLLLVFIFILSVFAYFKIPKEIFPISKLDAITITGSYAGASSDILDLMAVSKIEEELDTISEVDKVTTIIKTGYFTINVELKSGYTTADALDKVKDIISKIKTDLPADMTEPVVKETTHAFPLVTVAVFGDLSKEELLKIAKDIKSKLSKLDDLSNITIWGESDKELLLTFDEAKMEGYGVNKQEVITMLSQMSSIFPAGIIKDKGTHYYLSSQNGEKDLNVLGNTLLKLSNKTLYLKDIATIEYELADVNNASHFNGKRDMSIGINKGETGDSIALVKEIKEILHKEEKNYKNVKFDTYTDTSIWIKNRLNTVVSNIIFGVMLLCIALFFLVNARVALVVALGIPTSFMIGLIFAEYYGYSLNMLSLLGVLLALGMLVDEAIVVGENIYRHMEMGKDNLSAAIDGSVEMFPAVLTATATTVFAFLPILMLTGETGLFMKILPIMISILLISSLFEAFFFLPLHAKHSFKLNKEGKFTETFWEKNKNLYDTILSFVLKWKYAALIGLLTLIIGTTFTLFKLIKFEFIPEFDTTQVYINGSVGVGNSLEETEKKVEILEQKLLEKFKLGSNIDSISSVIGMKLDGKQMPQNEEFYFQIFVNLQENKPDNFFDIYINPYFSPVYDDTDMTREKMAKEIANEMRAFIEKDAVSKNDFKELKVYVPGAGIVKYDIEMALSGKNEAKVLEAIHSIKESLNTIKGVSNVADDLLFGNIDLKFSINNYGSELGFNETTIVNALKPYYFKGSFAKMYDENGVVDIVFMGKDKDEKESLDNFWLTIPNSDKKVLLKDIATIDKKESLSQIFKENGVAIKSITASISDSTSDEVYEQLQPTISKLDPSVHLDIKGEQQENQKVKKEMAQAFVIALLLIFIALVWMFDSIVKSLIILSTIPLSIVGVLIGNMLIGINLSMPGLIGIVGLAGVIVNDGIIMMDFIQNAKNLDELKNFALQRLRPILLTSLTTILGLSTLIFFASGQSLILQPMAVALGFGVMFATILNLYYVPMLYRIIYLNKSK